MSLDSRHPRWQHMDLKHRDDEDDYPDLSDADLEAQWERSFATGRALELRNHGPGSDDVPRVDTRCFDRDQHADEWRHTEPTWPGDAA